MAGDELPEVPLDERLVEAVAVACFNYDYADSKDWGDYSDVGKETFRKLAEAALVAAYKHAKVRESFTVRMLTESGREEFDQRDTEVDAERVMQGWSRRYGRHVEELSITHMVGLEFNVQRYWTEKQLDAIQERAAERVMWLKKYLPSDPYDTEGEVDATVQAEAG
jgi:hypothetical protein